MQEVKSDGNEGIRGDFENAQINPNQLRWDPFERLKAGSLDFVAGLQTICGAGRFDLQ